MHTVYCSQSRVSTDTLDLGSVAAQPTEPARSDSTLARVNPPYRFGYLTIDGDAFKACWMIDDYGARLVMRGVPVRYATSNNLAFCPCYAIGGTDLNLTFSDRDPMEQNRFADVTVKP